MATKEQKIYFVWDRVCSLNISLWGQKLLYTSSIPSLYSTNKSVVQKSIIVSKKTGWFSLEMMNPAVFSLVDQNFVELQVGSFLDELIVCS